MKNWKVGTLSAGIFFIGIGLLWLGHVFWNLPILTLMAKGWPVLLITLGLEIFLHQFLKKDQPLRFDVTAIVLILLLGTASFFFFAVQSAGLLPTLEQWLTGKSHEIQWSETMEMPQGIERVVINIPNGEIDVIGDAEAEEASAQGTMRVRAASEAQAREILEQKFRTYTSGDTMHFTIEKPKEDFLAGLLGIKADLSIRIPDDKHLQVRMVNGKLLVKEMREEADLQLVNGEIRTNDLQTVSAELVNGSIAAEETEGNLKASVINGDIRIDHVRGDVKADAVNGKLAVTSAQVTGDWEMDATNGNISLHIPKTETVALDASTLHGRVGGEVEWVRSRISPDHEKKREGKWGTEAESEHTIDLNNRNGNITVNWLEE